MPICKLETQMGIPTAGWDSSVQEFTPAAGPVTVTVPTSTGIYLGGASGLAASYAALLTANATLTGTYTCTVDDDTDTGTGRVTLSATGVTTFNVTWTSTDLRDALGFTGNLTGALTYTSTKQAKYLWLPNAARMPHGPDDTTNGIAWSEMTDYSVALAPSGVTARTVFETRYVADLEFVNIKGEKAYRVHEVYGNASFQAWFSDLMTAGGRPFRYHPDRSIDTVSATCVLGAEGSRLMCDPVVPGWVGAKSLFRIGPYPIHKKV